MRKLAKIKFINVSVNFEEYIQYASDSHKELPLLRATEN